MKRNILLGIGFLLMMASLYLIFIYAPIEKEMGIVQKIFYFMVPSGWLAMLSFVIIFISSILYLTKRETKWDVIAYSAAEIGIIFTTLTLVTGSIWARPTWGVWWDWGTPRLTATLMLWFIYLAYFMVRSFTTEESRGGQICCRPGHCRLY
ncbi:cytochrome c biogenesis protein [Chloroflexota bacterium]